MHVTVNNGFATIMAPDGIIYTVPYEPLSDQEMLLQARYHLWLRGNAYRRTVTCKRCKSVMEADTQANNEEQSWELLMVCQCRAIYGKTSLNAVHSAMLSSDS